MADFYNSTLIDEIKDKIKSNSNRGITGDILQSKLLEIVNALDLGGIFLGFATTSTNPSTQGTSKANGFYFSTGAGTYSNFIGENNQAIVVGNGVEIIYRELITIVDMYRLKLLTIKAKNGELNDKLFDEETIQRLKECQQFLRIVF